jgi:hypothetical protein
VYVDEEGFAREIADRGRAILDSDALKLRGGLSGRSADAGVEVEDVEARIDREIDEAIGRGEL